MGNILFGGVFHVTGGPDTGKTRFCLESGADPGEIVFVDDDLKTQALHRALEQRGTPFLRYINLKTGLADTKELTLYRACIGFIEELEALKTPPKAIIWDTWTRFEKCLRSVVMTSPTTYRNVYSQKGSIKGAEQNLAALILEGQLINRLATIAEQVFLVSHLGNAYRGGVATGGQRSVASRALIQHANFRVFLKHNPDSPAPIGLVLKRINRLADEGFGFVNVLPRKLKPCTWERIGEYWANPIGTRQPKSGEMPNAYELAILDDTLDPDEKMVLTAYATRQTVEEPEDEGPDETPLTTDQLIQACIDAIQNAEPGSFASKDSMRAYLRDVGFKMPIIIKAERKMGDDAPF